MALGWRCGLSFIVCLAMLGHVLSCVSLSGMLSHCWQDVAGIIHSGGATPATQRLCVESTCRDCVGRWRRWRRRRRWTVDGVAVGKKWRSECMCSSTVLTCVDPATGYGLLETSLPYAHTHTHTHIQRVCIHVSKEAIQCTASMPCYLLWLKWKEVPARLPAQRMIVFILDLHADDPRTKNRSERWSTENGKGTPFDIMNACWELLLPMCCVMVPILPKCCKISPNSNSLGIYHAKCLRNVLIVGLWILPMIAWFFPYACWRIILRSATLWQRNTSRLKSNS